MALVSCVLIFCLLLSVICCCVEGNVCRNKSTAFGFGCTCRTLKEACRCQCRSAHENTTWKRRKRNDVCDAVCDCYDNFDKCRCTFNQPRTRTQNYTISCCYDISYPNCTKPSQKRPIFASADDLIGNVHLRILFWLVGTFAFLGNSFVFLKTLAKYTRTGNQSVKQGFRWLILNLSLSDCLMSVYLIAISIQGLIYKGRYSSAYDLLWRSGKTCQLFGVLALTSSEASAFIMVTMTSFRLAAVCFPFKMENARQIWYRISTTIALLSAILVGTSPAWYNMSGYFVTGLLFTRLHRNKSITYSMNKTNFISIAYSCSNDTDDQTWQEAKRIFEQTFRHTKITGEFGYFGSTSVCMPNIFSTLDDEAWEFSMFLIILNFLLFIYMAICYLVIYKINSSPHRPQDGRKLKKRISILVATDFCCWVPVCVMACVSFSGTRLDPTAYIVSAGFLLPINSALNPIIYSKVLGKSINSAGRWFGSKCSRIRKSIPEKNTSELNVTSDQDKSGSLRGTESTI
ncbi:G-protein coupled receptor GRL101-like [Ciona intestinalis]